MWATILTWIAATRVGRFCAVAAMFALAVLTARAKWRHDGAADEREDARYADFHDAEEIREAIREGRAADAADPRGVNERLRASGGARKPHG